MPSPGTLSPATTAAVPAGATLPPVPFAAAPFALPTPAAAAAAAPEAVEASRESVQPVAPESPAASAAPANGEVSIANNSASKIAMISIIAVKRPGKPYDLVQNLEPFSKTNAPLPPKRGCVFNVRGKFENGSPLSIDNVDLCRDPVINVTVW
jgi:hypothetical protein